MVLLEYMKIEFKAKYRSENNFIGLSK